MQMNTESTTSFSDSLIRDQVRSRQRVVASYMQKVFSIMFLGLGVVVGVAFVVGSSPAIFSVLMTSYAILVPVLVIPFALILYMNSRKFEMSKLGLTSCYFTLCSFFGIWTASVPRMAIENPHYGTLAIVVFASVTTMFGGLSLFGFTTQKDMSSVGTFFISALSGLIAVGIINIIFPLGAVLNIIISATGVVVFSGLVAYDTQRIKQQFLEEGDDYGNAILGATNLLLNFMNLFLYLYQLCTGNNR